MLTLAAPALLWAAPAVCALALLAARRSPRPMPPLRRAAAAAVRAVLVLLLGAVLARPVLTSSSERPFLTVFAADVSESVPAGAWTASLPALREAWARESADGGRCALIAFAGRAETLIPATSAPLEIEPWRLDPRAAPADEAVEAWREKLETGATDVDGALAAARALFQEGATNRIVLITDGRAGAGAALPGGLRALRLPAPGGGRDAAVVSVQAPAAVRSGEPFDVRVTVHASEPSELALTLTIDEEALPEASRTVKVPAGRSVVVLPDVQQKRPLEAGLHRVLVIVGTADDELRNNSGIAAFAVTGRPRVLLVEGRPGEAELLARVFKAQEIEFERETPEGAARRAASLEEFAAVVLAGVPRAALGDAAARGLADYVERAGGGLWVVGSAALQGAAGYAGSPLEALLPVRYSAEAATASSGPPPPPGPPPPTPPPPALPPPDAPPDPQRVLAPAAAVLFVVDKSGSMAGRPITIVKEACLASAKTLGEKDYVGVLAFDRVPRWVVEFTAAGRQQEIQERLLRLFADGSTNIFPALVEAHRAFRADGRAWRCAVKHVILLSDGETVPADFESAVGAMRADGITVTSICVGASGNFDPNLMSRIADWGGGKFKFTSSYKEVPQLFIGETARILGAVPKPSADPPPPAPAPVPKVPQKAPPAPSPGPRPPAAATIAVTVKDPHEALEGVDGGALPPLSGRLAATARAGADVRVALAGSDGKPVLAFGRAGLGKTAAWTSDLGGPWSRAWPAAKDTARLVAQVVRHLAAAPPDVDLAARARVLAGPSGARVRIEPGEPVELLDAATRSPLPLLAEEDGGWTAEVALDRPGELRRLRLARRDGKSVPLGAVRAYESEFEPPDPSRDLFAGRADPLTWESLAALPRGPRLRGEERSDLAPWLALAAALLLPLDVALRRWRS